MRRYLKRSAKQIADKKSYMTFYRLGVKHTILSHYSLPYNHPHCMHPGCDEMCLDELELDHINGGGEAERRRTGHKGGINFYLYLIREGLPPGYQTLCGLHNMGKPRVSREEREAEENAIRDSSLWNIPGFDHSDPIPDAQEQALWKNF